MKASKEEVARVMDEHQFDVSDLIVELESMGRRLADQLQLEDLSTLARAQIVAKAYLKYMQHLEKRLERTRH